MTNIQEEKLQKYLQYFKERFGIDDLEEIKRLVNNPETLDISIFVSPLNLGK